jgi:hypothetical protein
MQEDASDRPTLAGSFLMWNNWIGQRIRRRGRMLLYWGLLLCAASTGMALAYRGHFAASLAGPHHASAEDLASPEIVDQLARRAVVFDADEVRDTGAVVSYARRKDIVRSRYLVVPASEHWLLLKVPPAHEGNSFTGYLVRNDSDERDHVIAPFAVANHIDPQRFLPYQLDVTVDTSRGLVAGLFFAMALLLPGLVLVAVGLRRLRHPETHPLARALQRFGSPAEIANTIDVAGQPLRLGPIEFADDWLICHAPRSGYTVFRCDDLVWVHQLIETVNRSPLHRIKLYDRQGVTFAGGGRADVIEAAVAAITRKVPWLVFGWDERVAKQWREDPASLVPRVEERREELRARLPHPDAT